MKLLTEDNQVNEGADANSLGAIYTQSRELRMWRWNTLRSLRFLLFKLFMKMNRSIESEDGIVDLAFDGFAVFAAELEFHRHAPGRCEFGDFQGQGFAIG